MNSSRKAEFIRGVEEDSVLLLACCWCCCCVEGVGRGRVVVAEGGCGVFLGVALDALGVGMLSLVGVAGDVSIVVDMIDGGKLFYYLDGISIR